MPTEAGATDDPATDNPATRGLTARGRQLIARQLLQHRNLAALGLGSGLVWALGRVAVPLVVSAAINRGIDRASIQYLLTCAGLLLAIGSVSAVAAGLRRFSGEALGAHVEADLRTAMFTKLQELDIAFHDRTPVGQLLTRASTDLQQIRQPVVNFPLTVSNAVLLLASTAVLLWLDPILAGLAVAPALLIIVVARAFMLRLGPAAAELQHTLGATSGAIQEAIGGIRTVKGLGTERREVDRTGRRADQAMDAALAVSRLRAIYLPVTDALPALGLVAVLWVGGLQVAHGSLGVGALVSFSYYVLMLIAPLRSIVSLRSVSGVSRAYSLAALPVTADELDDIEHYLPATRSELLFARGVIFVEGDAEEALLPGFAKALGRNLDELGITVCNVAGTNFTPYVKIGNRIASAVVIAEGPQRAGCIRHLLNHLAGQAIPDIRLRQQHLTDAGEHRRLVFAHP